VKGIEVGWLGLGESEVELENDEVVLRLAAPFIAEDEVEGGRCCGGRRSVSSARWLLVAMSIIF